MKLLARPDGKSSFTIANESDSRTPATENPPAQIPMKIHLVERGALCTSSIAVVLFALSILLLASQTRAQTAGNSTPVIEAHGHGEAQTPTDQAIISLAIDTPGDTAEAATKGNAASIAVITQTLKPYLDHPGDSIQSASLSIGPDYSNQGQLQKKIRTFIAIRRFNIYVPSADFALLGQLQAIAAADPNTRLLGTDNETKPGKIGLQIEFSSTAPTPEVAVQNTIQGSQKLRQAFEAKLNGRGTIETEDSSGEDSAPIVRAKQDPKVIGRKAR